MLEKREFGLISKEIWYKLDFLIPRENKLFNVSEIFGYKNLIDMRRILIKNIKKEIEGKREIKVKSKKEVEFIKILEKNNNVKKWGYEKIKVNYKNPYTGKVHKYIIDFIVIFKTGKIKYYEIKSKNDKYKNEKVNERMKKLNNIKILESRKIGIKVETIFL